MVIILFVHVGFRLDSSIWQIVDNAFEPHPPSKDRAYAVLW